MHSINFINNRNADLINIILRFFPAGEVNSLEECDGIFTVYNPEYVVSTKGKFMLAHHGYHFSERKKTTYSDCVRTSWRCTRKNGGKNQKGCKATAITIEKNGFVEALFRGVHCHEPPKPK